MLVHQRVRSIRKSYFFCSETSIRHRLKVLGWDCRIFSCPALGRVRPDVNAVLAMKEPCKSPFFNGTVMGKYGKMML